MTKAELYQKACMLPLLPGVYIIRDKSGTIIYIGKAKRLRIRVSQYFREGVPHDNKVSQMIAHAYAFDVIVCQSEFEALVLEASQIKAHTPKYNILLKDDKGYSYIKVTKEPWPRLSFVLQKEEDDAEYIGPYTSSFAARQMAETAMDAFLLPRCNKRFPQEIGKGRPCLNAHIGKCMAVCSGRISCENYNQAVKSAVHLIRYGKKDIVRQLREKMEAASERLDFETAALLRDQIMAIDRVAAGQKVVMESDTEMDVIALAGTTHAVCAAVLRYRDGRLTDKREFLFRDTTDIDAVREEFLPQYYLDGETIPKTIAVDALPPDAEALNEALNQARGTKVELYVPQRGDVAKLVHVALFGELLESAVHKTDLRNCLDDAVVLDHQVQMKRLGQHRVLRAKRNNGAMCHGPYASFFCLSRAALAASAARTLAAFSGSMAASFASISAALSAAFAAASSC